ncbi:MAG TPA: HD domain-containing protein [Firmicutes bacterium]|nr:HD domain-containing protein [Bacillota bacterium]
MKEVFVKDLKPGQRASSAFVVQKKQMLPFKDPSKGSYLLLSLADKTGVIEARVWDGATEIHEWLQTGDVVLVAGNVEEYRGNAQLVVQMMRPVPDNEIDQEDFLPRSTFSTEQLWQNVQAVMANIANPHLRRLVGDWFEEEKWRDTFLTAPAAQQVHHAYLGGLAEHSLEVVRLLEALRDTQPFLNMDLLRCGGLLHDIGKIREYTFQTMIDMTDYGRLIGHTVMGYEIVMARIERYPGFPPDLALAMGHLILSHHGELAYGAPVLPQTAEAAALHYADLMSARVARFSLHLAANEDGSDRWSGFDRILKRNIFIKNDLQGSCGL